MINRAANGWIYLDTYRNQEDVCEALIELDALINIELQNYNHELELEGIRGRDRVRKAALRLAKVRANYDAIMNNADFSQV